jgi:hypothetical protein
MNMVNVRWSTCFPSDVVERCSTDVRLAYAERAWQPVVIDRNEIPLPTSAALETWCDTNGVDVEMMTVTATYIPASATHTDGIQITAYARVPEHSH